jgi:hypothetical protein
MLRLSVKLDRFKVDPIDTRPGKHSAEMKQHQPWKEGVNVFFGLMKSNETVRPDRNALNLCVDYFL